ncbi:Uma2 family endonuclease [Streptomyces morookaense]|uniref:Uma2 family endonuclease n=1 Tax=Streptomyces morookaense TaxID=1970 RepID=UPI0019B67D43|nr:Uma2 family endonuclease [Streptomyces morookaense]GHF13730.1 hypothetical protein GCM10010359_13750 [Streptomyces morookaense]
MTTTLTGRTEMADNDEQSLDDMFRLLYEIVPEGYKGEIVGGAIHMSPQRRKHWAGIRVVLRQLEDHFGPDSSIECDVRLDLPGYRNGFVPDLYKVADGAEPDVKDNWHYQDVEFVFEVISRETADSDYGRKKAAYASGGIPVYVIADPYTGLCHVYTSPQGSEYRNAVALKFGDPIDLTGTVLGLTLATDRFRRE